MRLRAKVCMGNRERFMPPEVTILRGRNALIFSAFDSPN